VIQVRAQNVLPEHIVSLVLAALARYETELSAGALVVVEASRSRVRVLPLRSGAWPNQRLPRTSRARR
jgi:hypothetical protein